MTAALLTGAATGVGLVLVWTALVPQRGDLLVRVGRWDVARSTGDLAAVDAVGKGIAWWKVGRVVNRRMTRWGWDLSRLRPDMAITDTHLDTFVGRVAVYALVSLLLPSALISLTGGTVVLPLVAGVGLAAAVCATSVIDLRRAAKRRREALLSALSTYLDLIALNLAGGRGVQEALARAAELGRGWAFERITGRMALARATGEAPWTGLRELGEEVDLPELRDLGTALTLVGDSGARVANTLTARAGTLQQRALAEESASATSNEDTIKIALGLMAAGFIVGVGYPMFAAIMSI